MIYHVIKKKYVTWSVLLDFVLLALDELHDLFWAHSIQISISLQIFDNFFFKTCFKAKFFQKPFKLLTVGA